MERMVAKMRAGVERPSLGEDVADDEVEEGVGEVEVEVEEEGGEDGSGEVVVGEVVEVEDDMAVLAEVEGAVIGIGIMGEGVFPAAVVSPLSVVGDTEPPKVHPSPRGIDGP
jgi:hypothetical protein